MTSHKTEALTALRDIADALGVAEPIDGLARVVLSAKVQYAIAQVEAIAELKRARKAKAPAA